MLGQLEDRLLADARVAARHEDDFVAQVADFCVRVEGDSAEGPHVGEVDLDGGYGMEDVWCDK